MRGRGRAAVEGSPPDPRARRVWTCPSRHPAQALLTARREGAAVGVLLMDLDRFKDVNDSLGHHTGDLLLGQVAERLRARLRASDTVARLGGDEFAVLLPGVTDAAAASAVARELREALERPFILGDIQQLHIEASVGVAVYPDHGADADALIQHADIAMYQAKRGRLGVAEYDLDSDQSSPARLALLADLRRAIDGDELVLHYQPKVNLAGGVDGAEALLRWEHPERGLIPTAEFIPLAEHTGLMRPLTLWVLEAALRQARDWRRAGLDIALAVNLSAANLRCPTTSQTSCGASTCRPTGSRSRSPRAPQWPTRRAPRRSCCGCARSAWACRSTTSARDTRRWPTSAACRSPS